MGEVISSPQNARLKLVRKLATTRGRAREGAFAVEGEDLVLAALRAGVRPEFALIGEGTAAQLPAELRELEPIEVPGDLLADVVALAHPPRVVGVFDVLAAPALAAPPGVASVWLDGVGDPGNVGTVLRTADAFGAGVGLGPECADPFSPKAVRASMGAIFHSRLARDVELAAFAPTGRQVVALDADAHDVLADIELGPDPVFCIGAERAGVSDVARARADIVARIPQREDVDSLNAAIAASIVLYEWVRRQR